jgi:hypothetical protein
MWFNPWGARMNGVWVYALFWEPWIVKSIRSCIYLDSGAMILNSCGLCLKTFYLEISGVN